MHQPKWSQAIWPKSLRLWPQTSQFRSQGYSPQPNSPRVWRGHVGTGALPYLSPTPWRQKPIEMAPMHVNVSDSQWVYLWWTEGCPEGPWLSQSSICAHVCHTHLGMKLSWTFCPVPFLILMASSGMASGIIELPFYALTRVLYWDIYIKRDYVNVDFSSCFSICNLVFSHLQDLKYLERQAFNRFSCLHQVLKNYIPVFIRSLGPDEDRRTCWKLVSLNFLSPVKWENTRLQRRLCYSLFPYPSSKYIQEKKNKKAMLFIVIVPYL